MNRPRRTSFDLSREKIYNIFATSQSNQNTNYGKVGTGSAFQHPLTSKQKNVEKREPNKKRAEAKHKNQNATEEIKASKPETVGRRGRKKIQINATDENPPEAEQKNQKINEETNASKSETVGRRGRKKSQTNDTDENPPKRTATRTKSQCEPNVNSRWNTRSKSSNAANASLNVESIESNEPIEEHLDNEKAKEMENSQLSNCIIVMNRLTHQEIKNLSKARDNKNDKNITSQAVESQRPPFVARTESVTDEINEELATEAIEEATESPIEQIENDVLHRQEIDRQPTPAPTENDDENLDYLQMAMSSEEEDEEEEKEEEEKEEREDDGMLGPTSNNQSQLDSLDSGYQTGRKPAKARVQEWLKKIPSIESMPDVPDYPVRPAHEIILNRCLLSQMPSHYLPRLISASIYDKEKDAVNAFDCQSQISTHYSGTPKSVDKMSIASTHFSDEPELEPETISHMAAPVNERLNSKSVHESNLMKSCANATTQYLEDEPQLETNFSGVSPPQVDDYIFSGVSSNRTISVENVSTVSSSAKRTQDENESAKVQWPQSHVQFSLPILQPRPKRQKTGSVIQVPPMNPTLNRRIVSQPTRQRPEFHPNDFEHTSQPLAIAIVKSRIRPAASQQNSENDDSLSIDTPSDTDYQESNQQRFITQPTQLSHMNWRLSRNSSLESILATNSSNVSAIPKFRYHRNQEDPTCFPMVPNTHYTSFVINGETTFAVNDFDHGNATIRHHFLSRYNDSLNGLDENFTGIVYTTSITANLLTYYMKVDPSRIAVLRFDETICIENIKVTALELTSWPGATLFAFDTGNNGIILHVGDLRIPADTEGIEYLVMHRIRKFYFDKSCLMKVYYQIPNDIDRYVGLAYECTKYQEQNNNVGMIGMIVIGAFKHGMEPLILRLAEMLHMKVFMNLERREFLNRMLDDGIQDENSIHYRLRERVVDNPRKGNIHILDVDNINETYLSSYLSRDVNRSFHRMFAIRPRGNGSHYIQLALDRFIKIFDIPNPLVGDYYEYRRFIECVREDPEQNQRQQQRQIQ